MKISLAVLFFASCLSTWGQTLLVRVIGRQTSDTAYSYQTPVYSTSNSNATANCNAFSNSVNCSGSGTTQTVTNPSRNISYSVIGATLSLLLPDGRVAVVNCVSKYKPKGDYVNRRSCRMPIVDQFDVEFSGKNAKLKWPVSLDGKKMESETYKVLGILASQ